MILPLPFSLPAVRGVIVDLDGTMVDTLGDFEAALNRMLAEYLPRAARSRAPSISSGTPWVVNSTPGKASRSRFSISPMARCVTSMPILCRPSFCAA